MAKKQTKQKEEVKEVSETKTKEEQEHKVEKFGDYKDQYKRAFDYYEQIRSTWAEKEALVLCKPLDKISKNSAKSQVMDPRLLSISQERSYRVMAQLASGKVQAITKKDKSKSLFMDIVLHKYIVPNACSQYDALTKFRLVDFYSFVYGTFCVLVDYVIKEDYAGPDFFLLPVRDVVPQPSKTTIQECDYVFVRSEVSRGWLRGRNSKFWDKTKINELLEKTKGDGKNVNAKKDELKTYSETMMTGDYTESDASSRPVELVTKYMKDRWVTFNPEFNITIRDMPNPHKNNKIPIVVKHSFPLLDRFHGLGDFEKGLSLQYTLNSLINLMLDGVKISMYPPLKIDFSKVVASTITNEPAAKWAVKAPDAIQTHNVTPQGINTFQSTYQFMIAALMNQSGTTDFMTSKETDPSLGKTPEALRQQGARQTSRDAYDRFFMEQFITEVYELFLDLMAVKQEKPIKLNVFEEEIKRLSEIDDSLVDMFESGKAGELIIKPESLKDTKYRFFIDPVSTFKKDEAMENESIKDILNTLLALPSAAEQVMQTGSIRMGDKTFDVAELMKGMVMTNGLQDAEKIVKDAVEEGAMDEMGGADMQELGQVIDPMTGQPMGQPMPQGGMPQQQGDPELEQLMMDMQQSGMLGGQGGM